jgi:aspartate aminotransferase
LARAVTPRTRAIIINNPCNPTGALYSRSDLEAVARLAVEKDICVVSDEIYEKLYYTEEPPVSIAALGEAIRERTIVVNGVSKTYAMTGWRIGYAAAPLPVAKAMGSYQSHATSNPNTIAQYAALAALNGTQEPVRIMAAEFKRRRDRMTERIGEIPGLSCVKPDGAFYVMMNISGVLGRRAAGRVLSGAMDFSGALLNR